MFKVGQEVWDMAYGWGIVYDVRYAESQKTMVVRVHFHSDAVAIYSQDGRRCGCNCKNRVLFFEEIPIPKSALEHKEWRADYGGHYYYVDETGRIIQGIEFGYVCDIRFGVGNYFKTHELAKNSKYFKVFNQCE
ncbi:MAG: hypothetical protein ACRCTZ_16095 [Sarcina sp.]